MIRFRPGAGPRPTIHRLITLLALLLLTDARRPARVDDAGVPVSLEEQDRARWDQDLSAEAPGVGTTDWPTSSTGSTGSRSAPTAAADRGVHRGVAGTAAPRRTDFATGPGHC